MTVHWLTPAALAGLALLAIPVVLHLVARTPLTRIIVPSLRVVDRRVPRQWRRRRLRDPALLALRLAVLGAAVVASAGPLVLTGARQREWSAYTIRAIVADAGSTGAAQAAGAAAVADEQRTAGTSAVFAAGRLDAALPPVLEWLERQPPGRREIVFVGEGRPGTLGRRVADAVPSDVGVRVRMVSGAAAPEPRLWRGARGPGPVATADLTTRLEGGRATVAMAAVDAPLVPITVVAAPGDLPTVRAIHEAVVSDGVRLRPIDTWQPLRLEWPGAPAIEPALSLEPLRADDRRRLLPIGTAAATPARESAPAPWVVLGHALRAARDGSTIVIRTDAGPEPVQVERLVRAAVEVAAGLPVWSSGPDAWADPDFERKASGIGLDRLANVAARDTRWAWLLALAGLGLEGLVRRRRERATSVDDASSAGGGS